MRFFEPYIEQIFMLCKEYHVQSLYAFGSVLTDSFSQNSDIDMLVEFANLDVLNYADNYFDFKYALEDLLGRKVDLLEYKAIRNPFFKAQIDQKKYFLYGNRNYGMAS